MDDYLEQLRLGLERELGLAPVDAVPAKAGPQDGVSLIITREQRESLRKRGFTQEEIRNMTPAQAHQHLRNAPPGQEKT